MSKRARSRRGKEATKPYLGPRRVTVRKMKKVTQDVSSAPGPTWMILCMKNQTKMKALQKARIALGVMRVTTMTKMRKAATKASREKMNKKKITLEMTKKNKKTTKTRRRKMKKTAATKRKKRKKRRERQAD